MRSIRRSLTIYHLVLLGVTLGLVWIVIDQLMRRSLEARQAAVTELIQAHYENRVREEKTRIDQSLLDQAKKLGDIMQTHYWTRFGVEISHYNHLNGLAQLMFLTDPLSGYAWRATNAPGPRGNRNPLPEQLFRLYFANLPLPEEFIQHFDEENRSTDYYQINTIAGREWHSKSLDGRKLPFDQKEIDGRDRDNRPADPNRPEPANLIDWVFTEGTIDGQNVRRVLYKVPLFTARPPGPPRVGPGGAGSPAGPPQRSLIGAWAAFNSGFPQAPWGMVGWPESLRPTSLQTPSVESLPRLYIQCARPQRVIDDQLDLFAIERDAELAHLATEIRQARTAVRLQVATISLIAFLAIAIGGPLIVGTGLRPLGKLSDAVSRVSEKDFKLPHDGQGLSEELAPIHARLTQTLDLLQRAFAREKQSVADISHELRTPIAALMATIDVALRKPRTPEHYRTTLEECRLISRQLSQLVERIMTLASLDAGHDRVQIARTDGAELASACAAVIRPLAAANGVSVDVQADPSIELDTDPAKLREVLMNLLHNAVEYNQPNGSIELRARREGSSAVFEVRDTGIGMTPEVKERIFERFYRADPSRHSTGVHAGLGLAIVKEYVARLNGTITVQSEPGVGSTFRVTLPAADTQAEPAPRGKSAAAPLPVAS